MIAPFAANGKRQTESIPATGGSSGDSGNSNSSGDSGSGNGGSGSSNSGGGSHNSGGSGGSTSTTKPNTSTTTTVTNPQTGAKTVTTKQPDGSSTAVTTQKDGTITTVSTNTSGETKTEVQLSTSAITAAEQQKRPIALPITTVEVTRDFTKAPPLTIHSAKDEAITVAIPVSSPSAGTVAIVINTDGSTSVIKTSIPTENSIVTSLPNGTTIKIVDNSKSFSDVHAGVWSEDAIAFASARELFSGTTATTFSPDSPMTRAMLMTVLARFDGADTTGGDTWYTKGVAWATTHGISDGVNPNGNITREQLVTMLWRYLGSPAVEGSLSEFTDTDKISNYAQTAMQWAVQNDIVSGFGDGRLGPQYQATRAQVAQVLKNLITNLALNPAQNQG